MASVLVMPDSLVSYFVPIFLPLSSPHVLCVVLGNFGYQASVSFLHNLLHFMIPLLLTSLMICLEKSLVAWILSGSDYHSLPAALVE